MKKNQFPPHTYLAPSKIHGVGCFAAEDFKKGERVRVWDGKDCEFTGKRTDRRTRDWWRERYCVETKNGWWCPLDFTRMSNGWYLNHSDNPNLRSDDGGETYYTTRKVNAGQELTIDYKKLDPDVDNSI